jgi:chemotaxis protein CheX
MTVLDSPMTDDVLAIVEELWVSFLESADMFGPVVDDSPSNRSAAVTISGPTNMLVSLSTSEPAAIALASFLLQVEEPSADDVSDALGELVNVLGGSVKSLLPGPSSLSLPVTVNGTVTHSSGATADTVVEAVWSGHRVTVVTHTLAQEGAPQS